MPRLTNQFTHAAELIDKGFSTQHALRTVDSLPIYIPGDSVGDIDQTSRINDTIQEAEETGRSVLLGAGYHRISETGTSNCCLLIQKGIRFYGEGMQSVLLVDSGVDASTDIICLSPSTTDDDYNTGFLLDDFRILPESGTPGRHGISIDIRTRALYQSRITGVRIDQLGDYGIATLPNATPLSDGFFTSVIERNVVYGGIKLDKAGDSLRILRNTLTGTNVGVYVDLWCNNPGVDCFDGGPHGLEIIGNNITCVNGGLDCRNAHMGIFENNIVEPSPGGTFHNSAAVSIDGISTKKIQSFTISKNYLSTQAGNDVIYFGYTDQCLATDNYSSRVTGQVTYRVSANAVNTRLIDLYHPGGEARATVLDDQGHQTIWWRSWAGVLEQNQSTQLDFGEDILYRDSGGVSLPIIGLETGDLCKVGFQTAVTDASGGHLLFYADGNEFARIVPGGQFIVGVPSFPGGLNPLGSAAFQIESTTQGFYSSRMTTTQRNAISSPQNGCLVYDITVGGYYQFTSGIGWEKLSPEYVYHVPDSLNVVAGGTPVGTISDMQTALDGNEYNLPETTGAPGIDLEVNFTSVTRIRGLVVNARYTGSTSHYVDIQIRDYNAAADVSIIRMQTSTSNNYRTILLPDDTNFIDGSGNSQITFYHPTTGNNTHDLYVEYAALLS